MPDQSLEILQEEVVPIRAILAVLRIRHLRGSGVKGSHRSISDYAVRTDVGHAA